MSMKHFAELNYYDLLEISHTANPVQIRKAYEIAKKTYGEESIATYSLFDAASRKQLMEKIEEAFVILIDEERRQQYDEKLGLKVASLESSILPASQSAQTVSPAQPALNATPVNSEAPQTDVFENALPRGQEINGKFLKEIRERRRIPLQEVATKTRINITYLQFIEQDYFQGLPEEVYLRGYLVQYARMLGLDPTRVAEHYLSLYHNWRKSKKPA